ncbi:hypothetical protein F4809DRAFT_622299 [Biscogniauxia mediterranea]|nr:hypothetical protein F4809DRAFT_622299 [Biscogniauxia mediterranea]
MSLPPGVDLCQVPALTPPDGVIPNFTDPSPSLESTSIGITVLLTALGTVFVSGRVYANWRHLHISDYCAMAALVFDGALSGIILAMNRYMRHQWDTPACWFNGYYMKLNFVVQLVMPLSHSFSKAAILLVLLQIFTVDRKMRIAIYVGLAFTIAAYWPNLILVPIFSVPYSGETWDDMVTNPRVFKMTPVGTEQGTLAVLLDLYIFILPIPILASLNIKRTKRLHLIGIFGTALAGVIASIIGLAFRVLLLDTEDKTWSTARLYPCIIVEIYVALIVACMPAFAKFIRVHIFESVSFKWVSSRLAYYPRGNQNSSQKNSDAPFSWPHERSGGSHGLEPWWKPTFSRAYQTPGSSQERLPGFQRPMYHGLNDSARLYPTQTVNHVYASPDIQSWNSNESETGIAITRTYGVAN